MIGLVSNIKWSICQLFDLIVIVSYCQEELPIGRKPNNFEISVQWSYLNFTWSSRSAYESAVYNGNYIPENNVPAGLKYYGGRMYLSLPRLRSGTPVTLAFIPWNNTSRINPLLRPYPNWKMNVQSDCATLQSVQSMEIDSKGVMWVIDGNRIRNFTKCPPKLLLLDLNNHGNVLHIYNFSDQLSSSQGGFLNDIVVEEEDGGFAYITETSAEDPGLIIYSRKENRAWKMRDRSMFAEIGAENFIVNGFPNDQLVAIDGIALTPPSIYMYGERRIFYTSLTGFGLYSITNSVLKNRNLIETGSWRKNITFIGNKYSQSDGMIIDSKGNLYFGLLSKYAIAKWNTKKPFNSAKQIQQNRSIISWPDSFTFDLSGNIYVIANSIHKYFSPNYQTQFTKDIKFRIVRFQTGTKSYIYGQDNPMT